MGHCSLCGVGVRSTSTSLREQRALTLGEGLGQECRRRDLGYPSHLVLRGPCSASIPTLLKKGQSAQPEDSRIPRDLDRE